MRWLLAILLSVGCTPNTGEEGRGEPDEVAASPPADPLMSFPHPNVSESGVITLVAPSAAVGRAPHCTAPGIKGIYDLHYQSATRRHLPVVFSDQWCRLKAQCEVESNQRVDAVSPVGAVGICQFMAPTFDAIRAEYPTLDGRRNPKSNIEAAAIYNAQLLRYFYAPRPDECRWDYVWYAYNAGQGRINTLIMRKYGSPECPDAYSHELPTETRNYKVRIRDTLGRLQAGDEHGA